MHKKGFIVPDEQRLRQKIYLKRYRIGEYRWHFRADSGRIIADSAEGYINKSDYKHGIELVKSQSPDAEVEDQT